MQPTDVDDQVERLSTAGGRAQIEAGHEARRARLGPRLELKSAGEVARAPFVSSVTTGGVSTVKCASTSCLDLDDGVLARVYGDNARRLLSGLDPSGSSS